MKVIDFGQSVFYIPKKAMSFTVGTKFFKAPEIILDFQFYNYSIDIWSVGMIFGSIIFKKFPLVLGENLFEILIKIIELLGSDQLLKIHLKYGVKIPSDLGNNNIMKKGFEQFLNVHNKEMVQN